MREWLRRSQADDEATPGPSPEWNVSRVSISGGVAGLIVTLVMIGISLVGLPPTRWFLGVSLLLGIVVALLLRWTGRRRG